RINDRHEHDRYGAGRLLQRCDARTAGRQDDIRRQRDQFRREFANAISIASAPAVVDLHIPADGPAQLLQPLMESRESRLTFRIIGGIIHEHADAPHALALLRARRKRPRRSRAAEERYECAAIHSITSSALTISELGTIRPRAFAVFKLIASSNLVGSCTGRSAGLSPLRMRSAYAAACRNTSGRSTPYDIRPPSRVAPLNAWIDGSRSRAANSLMSLRCALVAGSGSTINP